MDEKTAIPDDSDRDRTGFIISGIAGLGFLVVATALYFHTQAYLGKKKTLMIEAAESVVEMPNPQRIDLNLDGCLVHAVDTVRIVRGASYPLLRLATDATCLFPKPEYYQYQEEENRHRSNDNTARRYVLVKRWTRHPVNTTAFRRNYRGEVDNTLVAGFDVRPVPAADAWLGAYRLPDFLLTEMPGALPVKLRLTREDLRAVQAELMPQRPPLDELAHLVDDYTVYFGADPKHPEVGDIRLRMTAAWPGEVSLVAVAEGDSFRPFTASNGESLGLVDAGHVSASRMMGGRLLANYLGQWGMQLGLAVVYVLVFLFWRHAQRWKGRGAVFLAVGCALSVMAAIWFVTRSTHFWGVVLLAMAAASFGLAASRKLFPVWREK